MEKPDRRPSGGVAAAEGIFRFLMIKPSHYDDDGYVLQWFRSMMPSNSLAVLHGLAVDCQRRQVLGGGVEFRFTTIDETNTRVDVEELVRIVEKEGSRALVGLVGVQSNQFPRALDLGEKFRARGLPVCIGGFHVSGCMAMLPELTPELQRALDLGISLYAGEAEGRLEEVFADAWRGELEPVYDYLSEQPEITNAPIPILPADRVKRTVASRSSLDAGRGCPFKCSFCTIINVQGRSSRSRHADDIEQIVHENLKVDIDRFFVTDDNFARNAYWEEILDRLIALRSRDGLDFKLLLQVDTLCHEIPGFVEKAGQAGVEGVFIGLENINPDSLQGAKKPQNRITEYRQMLQAWRRIGVMTIAGYILGFPGDTQESILRDIEIVKRELPLDCLEFFFLTPLPGSEDHAHDTMSDEEWQETYRLAWKSFYSREHVLTRMRRAQADGVPVSRLYSMAVGFYGSVFWEGVHPLEAGYIRLRFRKDRRPGLPIESRPVFWAKHSRHVLVSMARTLRMTWSYWYFRRRLRSNPNKGDYQDVATAPVTDEELGELELFQASDSARSAASKRLARIS